jgi:hypothetical protein
MVHVSDAEPGAPHEKGAPIETPRVAKIEGGE